MTTAGPGQSVATFDLPTVLRFADLALAALGDAREEIDALNVYPVPDGDTGTNIFLTFEAARAALVDAIGGAAVDRARRPAHRPGGLRPRRAARGPRQLRGDPLPAAPRPGRAARRAGPTTDGPVFAAALSRPPTPPTPRSASRWRAPSSRWPGPGPGGRGRHRRGAAALADVVRAAAGGARVALGRPPTSSRPCRRRRRRRRRPRAVRRARRAGHDGHRRRPARPPLRPPRHRSRPPRRRAPAAPAPRRAPAARCSTSSPTATRPPSRAAGPAGRARRLPRRRRRRHSERPRVERPRPRRRRRRRHRGRHRGRPAVPDPVTPLAPVPPVGARPGSRAVVAVVGGRRASPSCSRGEGVRVVTVRAGRRRPRTTCSRRSSRPAPPRWSCCPTTPG